MTKDSTISTISVAKIIRQISVNSVAATEKTKVTKKPTQKTRPKPHEQPEKKSGLLDAMTKTQEQIKKRRR